MSPTADLRAWPARTGAYIKMMLPGTKRDMRASGHSFPIISRQCDSVPSGHAFGARTYVCCVLAVRTGRLLPLLLLLSPVRPQPVAQAAKRAVVGLALSARAKINRPEISISSIS